MLQRSLYAGESSFVKRGCFTKAAPYSTSFRFAHGGIVVSFSIFGYYRNYNEQHDLWRSGGFFRFCDFGFSRNFAIRRQQSFYVKTGWIVDSAARLLIGRSNV